MNTSESILSNITSKTQVAIAVSKLTVGIIGIIMNLLVCFIIGTHQNLRQPFNHLLVSLSISDLTISFSVIFNLFINVLDNQFPLSNCAVVICRFDNFSSFTSTSAAALTLMFISIERYHAITGMHIQKLKLSSTRKLILIIWILSATGAIIPTIYTDVKLKTYDCTMLAIDNLTLVIVCFILLSLLCILPTVTMLIIYFVIINKLLKTYNSKKLEINSITIKRQKTLRHNILPVLGISILSAATAIPYLSLNGFYLIGSYANPNFKHLFYAETEKFDLISSLFFVISPVINPLLYNLASYEFRKTLYSMLK
ncbi:Neuromedin-U receptor 2 [Trichoplax sp. H2]|nr:Neuromedin-U receptor 2 [Trichoplax sp. H2]|eukprot:RDD46561.1 Neuromedin-U receptor 2 [Trichoplax sp. H2]